MPDHSPGPWRERDGLILDANGYVVAVGTRAAKLEDARLISLAPELLEHLAAILRVAEYEGIWLSEFRDAAEVVARAQGRNQE